MSVNFRSELIKASKLHFQAHVEKHRINVENLLNNSQGVADHPDIMDTIEKELDEISRYNDLLEVLDKYFSNDAKNIKKKQILNG